MSSGTPAQEIRAVAQRWIDEIWRPGSRDTYNELHAPDFVDHSPSGREQDRAAYLLGIEMLYHSFPDFTAVTDDLLVDEHTGRVAIRWTATATFQQDFLGFAATGAACLFHGIEILAIHGGQIHDRWGEWDGIEQLIALS